MTARPRSCVTDTYKMEVEVDAGDDDSKGDMIKSVTVNGKGIGEPTGYKTIRAAVENAKEIQMFTDAAQNYTLNVYTENATGGGVPATVLLLSTVKRMLH